MIVVRCGDPRCGAQPHDPHNRLRKQMVRFSRDGSGRTESMVEIDLPTHRAISDWLDSSNCDWCSDAWSELA